MLCGIMATLLFGLSPAVATAQSVRGHGKVSNGPGLSPSQISVDAWLDDDGVAHGKMAWTGDIPVGPPYTPGTGGPSEPFIIDVGEIFFYGNSAYVFGIVVASPQGAFNGEGVSFFFTDNSTIGEPDEIDGQAIEAGNITVND
jgi:hypothetical protein